MSYMNSYLMHYLQLSPTQMKPVGKAWRNSLHTQEFNNRLLILLQTQILPPDPTVRTNWQNTIFIAQD